MPAQLTTVRDRSDDGLGVACGGVCIAGIVGSILSAGVGVAQLVKSGQQQEEAQDFQRRQQLRQNLEKRALQFASNAQREATQLDTSRAEQIVRSNAQQTYEEAKQRFQELARDLGDTEAFAQRMAENVRQAKIAGAQSAIQEGQQRKIILGGLGALGLTGTIIYFSRRK